MLECICCYNTKSFTGNLLNHLFSQMDLYIEKKEVNVPGISLLKHAQIFIFSLTEVNVPSGNFFAIGTCKHIYI